MIAMALFVSMDTCAKYLGQTYSTVQIVWARYFFHLILLAFVLGRRLPSLVVSGRIGLQLIRSLLLLLTTGLYFTSLQFVPLAEASAIFMVAPVIVTALSVPILGEPVGPRRWAGVFIGFVAAVVIIRPGGEAMQAAALLPLVAACFYAFYQISTRFLSDQDPILTTLIYSAAIGALAMSALVPFYWRTPTLEHWPLFILLGLFGGIGHFALIKALTLSPAAVVAPFTYTNIIWATLFGFILFDQLPDIITVIGAAVVAASGLYIFHREQAAKTDS